MTLLHEPGLKRNIRIRDYLVTADGLYFAVISDLPEAGCYLTTLRYAVQNQKVLKLDTIGATKFLASNYPRYPGHSESLDTPVHRVPPDDVQQIYFPEDSVKRILQCTPADEKENLARAFIEQLSLLDIDPVHLGITGSLMLGFQRPDSDIDFVVYGEDEFNNVRRAIRAIQDEDPACKLDDVLWRDAWKRRNCSLEFDTYKRHELRKYNKLNYHDTKIDISCIPAECTDTDVIYPVKKLSTQTIQCKVVDDHDVFSFPARYRVDHPEIAEILAYTATYTGQAFQGETVEARGPVEIDRAGIKRLVIGTSREAAGEFLRVLDLT
ncbi:MAG: nucleotidyltransferase domain-containing protein [Thiotrichales bacterium]|nr:nucleotidyltransferase domain-containing protein [Thiotrichales bacterium]